MTQASHRRLGLLVIGINYAPEPVGIGPYTTGLCEALAARGHRVEVIAGQAYYPDWRRHPDQPQPGLRRAENGVGVRRLRHYIPRHPSGPRRVAHLLSFSISALLPAIRAARRQRPDVVFAVAPSLLSVPVAWLAARLCGARLWVHVQDFEVEAAFATGLLEGRGLAARLARWLETRLLALADHVSTISPQMLAKAHDKGIAPGRTFEFRNWADPDFVPDEAEAARYRAEWGLGERIVALYSGNIANKQGIDVVIAAARLMQGRRDIAFVICGQGPNRGSLAALCQGLDNVQLHDLQPRWRVGGLLAMADMHLLPQIAGAADLVLPSKLTNMLISGRPVIATADPGTGLAREIAGCGLITPPGDAAALAEAVAALADDAAARRRLGEAAAARAAQSWHKAAILSGLEQALLDAAPVNAA